jgi:putative ABC transport system permease protein
MTRLWTLVTAPGRRLIALLHHSSDEREVREEMQFHLDMAAKKYRVHGLDTSEAARQARVAFGGVEQWREAARDELRSRWLEHLVRDVGYAVRSLRRVPAFALTVIVSLGLGIGAVSTVWTVTERVILNPLPYGGGGPLVFIWTNYREKRDERDVDSFADYLDWKNGNRDIERAAVFNIWAPTLTEGSEPEPLVGSRVSADFFDVLGVRPMLGRGFRADEDVPNGPPVAVIANSLWLRRFHGDRAIVGKAISVNGFKYTVVGVMPPSFRDPEPFWKHGAEIWRPIGLTATTNSRQARYLRVVARLKPGVTIAKAQRDLDVIASRLSSDYPETNAKRGALIVPIQEQVVGASRPVLLAALGGAVCLLLIVCGNVATLVLARHAVRAPELAVRAAIGAARTRIAGLLALESLVLSFAGAGSGLLVALLASTALRHFAPPGLPRVEEIHVDLAVVGATALCAIVAALVFGVAPSWSSSRVDLATVLQSGGARTTDRGRLRGAIVVGELAFSLVLLVAAGLLVSSMRRLNDVPLGLDADGLVTFDVRLPGARYASDTAYRIFFARLSDQLRRTNGISGVAMTSSLPFTGYNDLTMSVGGSADHPLAKGVGAHFRSVTPGYFSLLRIPLTGRDFNEQDGPNRPRVAILNRAAAGAFFPGQNPIGRRFLTSPTDSNPQIVVGVSGDVRFYGPTSTPEPEVFEPQAQYIWNDYSVLVRGAGPAAAVFDRARTALRAIDPNVPMSDNARFSELPARFSGRQRYYATVFGLFAGAALVLSAIGIFGLIAYVVTERQREIAIRLALGARSSDIARRFVARAALLVVFGVAIGTGVAMVIGRALASLLFGVGPTDFPMLIGSAAVLGAVALIACIVPALRAAKSSPAQVLR